MPFPHKPCCFLLKRECFSPTLPPCRLLSNSAAKGTNMHSVQEDFYEGNASHVQQHKSSGNKVKRLPFCVTCQNHLNRSEKEVIGERSFQRRHTPILQMLALNSMWEGYGNNCRKPTSRCVGSRRRARIKSKKKVERNPRLVIAKIIRPQGAKCSQEDELR